MKNEKLILSLDMPDSQKASKLLRKLGNNISWLKVGFQSFSMFQPNWLNLGLSYRLFLDLKFYDTPDTIERNIASVTQSGVNMTSLHVSGGMEMMKMAVTAATKTALNTGIEKPILLGVTVLTTMNEYQFYREGSAQKILGRVIELSKEAKSIGLDGIICSPLEAEVIRNECGDDFIIVCPGIRPKWARAYDQKRHATPADAIRSGADYIVVGRPILNAKDPLDATLRIIEEIDGV